jgi:multiple antibiotic resistance protein
MLTPSLLLVPIIIFIMALEMVLNVNLFKDDGSTAKTASIVPLAFPIIAGAGSMTTILSLRAEFEAVNIAVAIFLKYCSGICYFEAYW